MKTPILPIPITVIILATAAWLLVLPLITANSLKTAVIQGDLATISANTDFVALRQSVRGPLQVAISRGVAQGAGDNPLASAVGTLFASALLDPLIERAVSPEGIVLLLRDGVTALFDGQNRSSNVGFTLQGLGRFAITITDASDSRKSASLILLPQGVSWKLSAIEWSQAALGQ
jgi:hypothetical protein